MPENTEDLVDTEPPATLDDTLVEERIINLENTKLCRVRTVLGLLEGPRYSYEDTEVYFQNPIPVEDDSRRRIGFATVALEGTRLIADLALEYSSPERLGIETGAEKFYAHVEGCLNFESDSDELTGVLDLKGYKRLVQSLDIWTIQISKTKPEDERLEALGGTVL